MPTNWCENTPIAYIQGMSVVRMPFAYENCYILYSGQKRKTLSNMSAIRGLQRKFRNNFRELRYRGGIFAKFAVGK